MSDATGLSQAELLLLADAPLAAAAAVALAEEGGGIQEAAAIVSGWREAAASFADSALIRRLAAEMDPEDRAEREPAPATGPTGPDQIRDEAVRLCIGAVELLEQRAPADLEAYQSFVMQIAQKVATATGGGLFGGERVSRAERSAIREIAAALRYRR